MKLTLQQLKVFATIARYGNPVSYTHLDAADDLA